ncbi:hypothetical protein N007_11080 [Alicyclobacillus acidoterrestris ATCC 49025]|nr:hypothetical protein N007_11080 [Alicyclobacillus acidoterrestris ATCC 49025]
MARCGGTQAGARVAGIGQGGAGHAPPAVDLGACGAA